MVRFSTILISALVFLIASCTLFFNEDDAGCVLIHDRMLFIYSLIDTAQCMIRNNSTEHILYQHA